MLNEAKDKILRVLATGTPEEKSTVLEEIREVKDTSLVNPLVEVLERENSRAVKERILMVLERLIPLGELKEVDVDPAIERMLRSPDPFVRNGIVEIIQRSEMPIMRFLERLAEDEDKGVRKFVIDALSREKSERGREIIRKRLQDPEINIVYTAIEYLGSFRDIASVDTIESLLLSTDNLMVVCSSLEALAKIGQSLQKDKILQTFMKRDGNPVIIFPLLKYLGTFGAGDVFPFIEYILGVSGETLTKEIIDAVEGIVTSQRLTALPQGLWEKLKTLQKKTPNSVDKYAITKLLMKTAAGDAADARDQLRFIRQMLKEENEMLQLCAIEILADIGDESDVERLEELAEHTQSEELLEAIGDAAAKINERQ